jgi:TPR repeat protein
MIMLKAPFKLCLLVVSLAVSLRPGQLQAEDSPQTLYDRGLALLNDYGGSRQTKLEGWAMMEKAAAAGYLKAKIEVAELDAGFLAVMQPHAEEDAEFAKKYHLPKPPALLKPNLDRALEYFRDAVQSGDVGSMVHLASLYSSGIGEPRDESETPHELLLAAARKGDGGAMLHLSNRYLYGHGEKVDLLEAARWRYMARDSFDWHLLLDEEGNPKVQENIPMSDLAAILSLIVKAVEKHDANAISALKAKYAEAGKPNAPELKELLSGTWHRPVDSVEITDAKSAKIPGSDITSFKVRVSYNLASKPHGVVMLGLDLEHPGQFKMLADAKVDRGVGEVELKADVKDLKRSVLTVYANLSEDPHPESWDPLAITTYRVTGLK